MSQTITIDGEEYEEIPRNVNAATLILEKLYSSLGRPQEPFSEAGQKMMNTMLAVWEDLYPSQAKAWYEQRKEYQNAELSISEQVSKSTGRSLASIPGPVYKMMRVFFPEFKHERENFIKLAQRWPQLRMANKI